MAVAAAGGRRRQQQPARLVLLLVLLLGALSLRAFPGAHAAFTCDGGSKTLPDAFMNDGYCDCPEDGADEPATSACSLARRDESFTCGKSADGLPHRLFPSRVGDRICDCCDGTHVRVCARVWAFYPSVHVSIHVRLLDPLFQKQINARV